MGSRIDGFVAHLLLTRPVIYLDIRPLPHEIEGLQYVLASILGLPLADNSCQTLSTLHAIEHIGLGRYGDPVDPSSAT